jgi:hypothetical protein
MLLLLNTKSKDEGSMFVRNAGVCLQVYTALQTRRKVSAGRQILMAFQA